MKKLPSDPNMDLLENITISQISKIVITGRDILQISARDLYDKDMIIL